jgi:hypothetical protein
MRIFTAVTKDNKNWKVFADNAAEVREISVRAKKVRNKESIIKVRDETEYYVRHLKFGEPTREALQAVIKGVAFLDLKQIAWVIKEI